MLRHALIALALLVTGPRAFAADTPPIAGVSYSPSGVVAFADFAKGIDDAHLRRDLAQLKPLTHEIRVYSTGSGMDRLPAIAAELGMKVTVGAWVSDNPQETADEIARAAAAVRKNPQVVTRVIVGNEAIQRGFVNDDQLIAAMDSMRRAIAGTHIPVGTAEIWSIVLDHPRVAQAADFVGVHIIPYWDGVPAADAPAYIASRYDQVAKAFPGKPIVIGETGWPSSGPVHQAAVPSPETQAKFTKAFAAFARQHGYTYFLCEAYDQPWKAATEGDSPLWGLFDIHSVPKPAVTQFTR